MIKVSNPHIDSDHKVEQLNQDLVGVGEGVGLMSVECGRKKHFDKGLMKKVNGVGECQQTE